MKKTSLLFLCLSLMLQTFATDNAYHYDIDITKTPNRTLHVELTAPLLSETKIVFSLPKIVPGTYSIYNFGRFVENLKATDRSGAPMQVTKLDTNSWEIANSNMLGKITYDVHDTYHASKEDNPIFEPAGTDFQADTCYVLNLHTILGYFRNHTKLYYEINVTHQANLYGSTSMVDRDNSDTKDQFIVPSYNEAIDNPIMYTVPDTAHIKVGESDILISVYSPGKKATAKGIALQLDTLLQDQGKYLGGKLPVQKYSFLIYLAAQEGLTGGFGALEHSYGSMYYLIDGDDATLAPTVRNVASHEFFHIVTPLNIHSDEIANFNFDQPRMSEHLWLYEGSTEYHAHSVQVRYGLISQDQYLAEIKTEMSEAMFGFNDSLSFTDMSMGCLGKYKDQYNNVYAKGPLISMCLDLKLLHLSDGKYRLMNLIQDLSKSYGKDRSFHDDELFPKIVSLTYPAIDTFINEYIVGSKHLPFEEVLGYAGVDYTRIKKSRSYSFGQCDIGYNPESKRLVITGIKNENTFGQSMGYQVGDEILKVNGKELSPIEFRPFREKWLSTVKDGDKLKITVLRKTPDGKESKKTLKAKVFQAETKSYNVLSFSKAPTDEQLKIRKAWLVADK
jgi:predicted metalloprotease with PDZ domain